jgi:ABC-type branched-subunit amino acid transport system ATPase component
LSESSHAPLLRLESVTKRFGGTVAVDDVSLAVPSGNLVSLIGPNGAGKTSLVNLVAGRYGPDAGRLWLAGRPIPPVAHRAARLGVGRLFQDVRLFGSLTVLENVMLGVPDQPGEGVLSALAGGLASRQAEAKARVEALAQLDFVGLADRAESLAVALSYGQQKLVALARVLASDARLLLLDEPASGLNPRLVGELATLLRRIVGGGHTVLLVEHNMDLVERVSDSVALLDRGRLRAHGSVGEVWASEAMHEAYFTAADG